MNPTTGDEKQPDFSRFRSGIQSSATFRIKFPANLIYRNPQLLPLQIRKLTKSSSCCHPNQKKKVQSSNVILTAIPNLTGSTVSSPSSSPVFDKGKALAHPFSPSGGVGRQHSFNVHWSPRNPVCSKSCTSEDSSSVTTLSSSSSIFSSRSNSSLQTYNNQISGEPKSAYAEPEPKAKPEPAEHIVDIGGQVSSEGAKKKETIMEQILSIVDEQELGKLNLGLPIPLMMGLLAIYKDEGENIGMTLVAAAFLTGFVLLFNGMLLRKTWRKFSAVMLGIGTELTVAGFFSFGFCILSCVFKWLLPVLFLLSNAAFIIGAIDYCLRRRKGENKKP